MTNAKDDDAPAFAFQAQSWTRCLPKVHILSEVFRQKDPEFIQLLQEIRLGRPSAATLATLRSRTVPMSLDLTITKKAHQEDLEPTLLFCDNAKVNQMNDRRLALLKTTPVVFTSVESSRDPMFLRQLDQVCLAPRELVLKRYAQVMLLKNLSFELKLVNGSQGIVVGFARDPNTGTGFCSPGPQDIFQPPLPFPPGTRIIPVVRFAMGVFGVSISSWQISDPSNPRDALATRHQIPLRLAWAVTIHKSQGLTLQSVDVDLSNCFSCGQMYTALSRVSSLEGLRIRGEWKNSAIWAHPEAIQFYNQESEKTAQTPEHPD
jgi:ATP-dependent DNA helicase PIF1